MLEMGTGLRESTKQRDLVISSSPKSISFGKGNWGIRLPRKLGKLNEAQEPKEFTRPTKAVSKVV